MGNERGNSECEESNAELLCEHFDDQKFQKSKGLGWIRESWMNECWCWDGFDSHVDDRKHFSEGLENCTEKRHQCRAFVGWGGERTRRRPRAEEQERKERKGKGTEKRERSIEATTCHL